MDRLGKERLARPGHSILQRSGAQGVSWKEPAPYLFLVGSAVSLSFRSPVTFWLIAGASEIGFYPAEAPQVYVEVCLSTLCS